MEDEIEEAVIGPIKVKVLIQGSTWGETNEKDLDY